MTKRRYDYTPDLPDKRDRYFRAPSLIGLPSSVDLRAKLSTVEDQGNLGSCTANAWVSPIEMLDKKNDGKYSNYSRLYVYYNERALRGKTKEDSGAYIRDGAKAIAKYGACTEKTWPYKVSQFAVKPPAKAYTEGKTHKGLVYNRVSQTEGDILSAVAAGLPVVYGFSVYDSFESNIVATSGFVPMPLPTEKLLGGHANVIVGYNTTNRHFISRNSWGKKWGDKGYCYMPFEYVLDGDLAEDFWVLQKVSGL